MIFRATRLKLILILFATVSAQSATNKAWHFSTGPERGVMVEQYTSEGCSSCPRADAWLSRFKDDTRLWKQVFPIAFHVDYWDRLGWPDRFASKEWTMRQRSYGRLWRSRSIYTPGFAVNGLEWRGFFKGEKLPSLVPSKPGKLTLSGRGQTEWRVRFESASPRQDLMAQVVLLGFDASTSVARGENHGRRLTHDFVVLALQTGKLTTTGTTLRMPRQGFGLKRLAVVAWISKTGDPTPIQVTGGWLD